MKRKLLIISMALFSSGCLLAQQGDGGIPHGSKLNEKSINVDTKNFLEPDVATLKAEDALVDGTGTAPWRFGYNNETNLNFNNSGTWIDLVNGGKIWQLHLVCENALTVNLTFENLIIPEGNELYVFNPDKSFILGKFIDYHTYEGQLGTELVPGSEVIVEYYVAPQNINAPRSLTIDKVTHGYRSASEFIDKALKAFGSSGGCNMNAECPDGIPIYNEIRATMMLVSGSNGFCTGSMINNCNSDGTPYVLTANHCYSNPATWIFRFNWQSSTCANPASSPTFESLSGAVLRARRTPSDMCLVEITGGLVGGTVPLSFNTYFPGWDHSDTPPLSTHCVHHPSGDIKKISFDDNPATSGNGMGSTEANSQWTVQWDRNTTTEPGSSGSPLFDQNGRIVGQLWGGGASCSNLTAPDYYGKVSYSWDPAGSNSTNHLVSWLDPCGTAGDVLDGYDPNQPTLNDDAGITSILSPEGVFCTDNFDPEVVLRNYGANDLTSVTINYDIDGAGTQTFPWTGTLAPGATVNVTLPNLVTPGGAHVFNAYTSDPNGNTDTNPVNDDASSNYTATIGGLPLTVTIDTDCWGYEIYWEITDASSNVVASGGNSDITLPGGAQTATAGGAGAYGSEITVNENLCLAAGCYDFTIYDDWGDGLAGAGQGSCTTDGSYMLTDGGGNTLISILDVGYGTSTDPGNIETQNFCLQNPCNSTFDYSTVEEQCNGDDDGSVTVAFLTGNSTGATYDIGTGVQSNGTFPGLAQGTYNVTVVDGDACTTIVPVTLGGPTAVSATSTATDESCPGASDGSISVNASGGTPGYTYDFGSGAGTNSTETGLAPAGYTVTVADANGCSTTTSATVGSPAALSGSVTTVTHETNGGDGAINITVSGGGSGVTYTWTGPNGFTSGTEDPSGLSAGDYSVIITDDCGGQVTLNATVEDHTGFGEIDGLEFVIFPNPSNGEFTVQFIDFTVTDYNITVTDVAGRIIYEATDSGSKHTLDLANVADGAYMLRITSNELQTTKTIVVRK